MTKEEFVFWWLKTETILKSEFEEKLELVIQHEISIRSTTDKEKQEIINRSRKAYNN